MKRGHKRIPDRSYGNVVPFIEQAVATFDKLVQNPAVKSKLLVVDGDRNLTIAADYKDDALFGLAIKVIGSGLTQSLVCDQQVADRS
jgi:hypothetical protein